MSKRQSPHKKYPPFQRKGNIIAPQRGYPSNVLFLTQAYGEFNVVLNGITSSYSIPVLLIE